MLSEKVTRPHVRAGRPISLPSVPVSEGIEIRHGCQFLSSLLRALCKLPGGLSRFMPCNLGSHLSRLRHVGWNQCSHGLNSRPLESCHHQCLKALCGVLGYPKGSALELLDGTLKLRHCTDLITKRFLPWPLPRVGSGVGKRHFVTTNHHPDAGSSGKKGQAYQEDSSMRSFLCHSGSRSCALNAEEMEKIALPFLRRRGGRGGRALQSFSSPWSWVIFALGKPGTCLRREQA